MRKDRAMIQVRCSDEFKEVLRSYLDRCGLNETKLVFQLLAEIPELHDAVLKERL